MKNKYIRDKFNGLTEEIYKWDCVSISPFFKEEFRSKVSEEFMNKNKIIIDKLNKLIKNL